MLDTKQATCKQCNLEFPADWLIWGDKGGMYWVCASCYEAESGIVYCGDCLQDIKICGCDK